MVVSEALASARSFIGGVVEVFLAIRGAVVPDVVPGAPPIGTRPALAGLLPVLEAIALASRVAFNEVTELA